MAAELQKSAILIRAIWDEEARVWVATTTDFPGLAAEAETLDLLTHKLEGMVEDLVELNGLPEGFSIVGTGREIPLHIMAETIGSARIAAE